MSIGHSGHAFKNCVWLSQSRKLAGAATLCGWWRVRKFSQTTTSREGSRKGAGVTAPRPPRKKCGRRARSQRQGEHRHQREARSLEQRAGAIVQILEQHFHAPHAPGLAAFFPNLLFTPEFEPRLPPRFLLDIPDRTSFSTCCSK